MTEEQKENMRIWITALRSGEYKQGQYHLKQHHTLIDETLYCCLGVALEVMGIPSSKTSSGSYRFKGHNINLPDPDDFYALFGIDFRLPKEVCLHLPSDMLSVLNDDRVPFNVIADALEATLELMEVDDGETRPS